tara:strand:+ start:16173 stop:16328 length:156 start_codon:yes stop_codon:yes gene_type:complete
LFYELAFEALKEKPKAILTVKPFATPDLAELYSLAKDLGVKMYVGYDHSVG